MVYKIFNRSLKNIIQSIIKSINNNKLIFEKLKYEDKNSDFSIDKLVQVLQNYSDKTIIEKNPEKIIINYYGNPYLTAKLCVEGVINQTDCILVINNVCYGINKAIVKIINEVLCENKISTKFDVQVNFMIQEVERMNIDKIVCLGDTNSYMVYKNVKNAPVKCVPLYGTTIYYDSNEYDGLVEDMKKYAFKNGYELEVFNSNEKFDDVLYMINKTENNYCSLLLSKDTQKQEKFKDEINAKMICVNENPFSKFKLEIPNELWK